MGLGFVVDSTIMFGTQVNDGNILFEFHTCYFTLCSFCFLASAGCFS